MERAGSPSPDASHGIPPDRTNVASSEIQGGGTTSWRLEGRVRSSTIPVNRSGSGRAAVEAAVDEEADLIGDTKPSDISSSQPIDLTTMLEKLTLPPESQLRINEQYELVHTHRDQSPFIPHQSVRTTPSPAQKSTWVGRTSSLLLPVSNHLPRRDKSGTSDESLVASRSIGKGEAEAGEGKIDARPDRFADASSEGVEVQEITTGDESIINDWLANGSSGQNLAISPDPWTQIDNADEPINPKIPVPTQDPFPLSPPYSSEFPSFRDLKSSSSFIKYATGSSSVDSTMIVPASSRPRANVMVEIGVGMQVMPLTPDPTRSPSARLVESRSGLSSKGSTEVGGLERAKKHKTRPSLSGSRSAPILMIETRPEQEDANADERGQERDEKGLMGSRPGLMTSASSSGLIAGLPRAESTSTIATSTSTSTSIRKCKTHSAIRLRELFAPYTTLVNIAAVPVGHFTARPSRLVVQTRTERSSPHESTLLASSGFEGVRGVEDETGPPGMRTRQNTAEKGGMTSGNVPKVGLGVGLDGCGIGLALQSWTGGWRPAGEAEAATDPKAASTTVPMTRCNSSRGQKRQRLKLKRADELVGWCDPGYRLSGTRSAPPGFDKRPLGDMTESGWGPASPQPIVDPWEDRRQRGGSGEAAGDGWTSFSTQDTWDEAGSKKYDDRFGEGKVEKDLQGALDDLQKTGKYALHAAVASKASKLSDPQAGTGSEPYPEMIDYGALDDEWEDEDESEIFVYSEQTGGVRNSPSAQTVQISATGEQGVQGNPEAVQEFHSPPPPPSPQLKDSPERSWSGALGLEVRVEQLQEQQWLDRGPPQPPALPESLGKIFPFRHIVHLAAVNLDIMPEDLIEQAGFPRFARACGVELHLAKVLITAELEFQPLVGGIHQTRHDIYTYHKQCFRNREAGPGSFQGFVAGLIQLATSRPVGENPALTLQSLMADMTVVCLDYSGSCEEHFPADIDERDAIRPLATETELGTNKSEVCLASMPHANMTAPYEGTNDQNRSEERYSSAPSLEILNGTVTPEAASDTEEEPSYYSISPSSPLLDKGKGKLEVPAEAEDAVKGEDQDGEIDMDLEKDDDGAVVPDLISDYSSGLYFGTSIWSVGARVIGMLSRKAGCPGDHVLDLEEVAMCLETFPGISAVQFKHLLEEAMTLDRTETGDHRPGQWANFGDEYGIWKGCRLQQALMRSADCIGHWAEFPLAVVGLLQLYFDWDVGQDIQTFLQRLNNEQVRHSHLPFEPTTPSTITSSPPMQHYPDPYLAETVGKDRVDELERVARLQIGPSSKQW